MHAHCAQAVSDLSAGCASLRAGVDAALHAAGGSCARALAALAKAASGGVVPLTALLRCLPALVAADASAVARHVSAVVPPIGLRFLWQFLPTAPAGGTDARPHAATPLVAALSPPGVEFVCAYAAVQLSREAARGLRVDAELAIVWLDAALSHYGTDVELSSLWSRDEAPSRATRRAHAALDVFAVSSGPRHGSERPAARAVGSWRAGTASMKATLAALTPAWPAPVCAAAREVAWRHACFGLVADFGVAELAAIARGGAPAEARQYAFESFQAAGDAAAEEDGERVATVRFALDESPGVGGRRMMAPMATVHRAVTAAVSDIVRVGVWCDEAAVLRPLFTQVCACAGVTAVGGGAATDDAGRPAASFEFQWDDSGRDGARHQWRGDGATSTEAAERRVLSDIVAALQARAPPPWALSRARAAHLARRRQRCSWPRVTARNGSAGAGALR